LSSVSYWNKTTHKLQLYFCGDAALGLKSGEGGPMGRNDHDLVARVWARKIIVGNYGYLTRI
jgi:hypothetical protein